MCSEKAEEHQDRNQASCVDSHPLNYSYLQLTVSLATQTEHIRDPLLELSLVLGPQVSLGHCERWHWTNGSLKVNRALVGKNLPVMHGTQETRFPSLGWEDPLEEEMATHSSTLVWRIRWTEEHGGLQSMGSQMSWLSNWKSIAVTWTWFLQSIFIQVLFQSLSYQVLYSVGYQEQTVDPIKKSQDEALCFGQGLHMGLMTPGLCLMMRILCSLQRRDM